MESHVVKVWLYDKVTLDIRILMQYDGQGKCREVGIFSDTANRYREQFWTWTTSTDWEVKLRDGIILRARVQRPIYTKQKNVTTSGHSAPTSSCASICSVI